MKRANEIFTFVVSKLPFKVKPQQAPELGELHGTFLPSQPASHLLAMK